MLQLTDQNLRRSLGGKEVYVVLMSGANLDRKSQRGLFDNGVKIEVCKGRVTLAPSRQMRCTIS